MASTVAVCIPAYRGRFLAAALQSVISQTRQPDEIIVLDDCSPDDIQSIVSSFKHPALKYLRNETNVGVPENYNHVLRLATSDYFIVFGDHDIMLDTFLERHVALLDQNPGINYVFSAISVIDENGEFVKTYPANFPRVSSGQKMAERVISYLDSPVTLNTMIRRSSLEKLPVWFDSKYWWYADIDLWLRLSVDGQVGCVHEPVLQKRVYEKGHYLEDKRWRATVMCDQIRKDNWSGIYANRAFHSRWALFRYSMRKDILGLRTVLSALGGNTEVALPDVHDFQLFSPMGKALIRLLMALPRPISRQIRTVYRRFFPSC